jgi:hypothetical protein
LASIVRETRYESPARWLQDRYMTAIEVRGKEGARLRAVEVQLGAGAEAALLPGLLPDWAWCESRQLGASLLWKSLQYFNSAQPGSGLHDATDCPAHTSAALAHNCPAAAIRCLVETPTAPPNDVGAFLRLDPTEQPPAILCVRPNSTRPPLP